MNLNAFAKQLWKRFVVQKFQKPFLAAVAFLLFVAAMDYLVSVDVFYRVAALVAVALGLSVAIKKIFQSSDKPNEEEVYQLACQVNGDDTLTADPQSLTLPSSILKPWALKSYLAVVALVVITLSFPAGRMAFQRTILLTGKRTLIKDLQYPEMVVQGSPIKVSFRTEGRTPSSVILTVNGQDSRMTWSGKERWEYEFFEHPGEVSLRIEAGDDKTEAITIQVLNFPSLIDSEIRIKTPQYLGGDEKIIKGLQAKVPEGSQVALSMQFRDLKEVESPSEFKLTENDTWVYTVGDVTQDKTIPVRGRSHAGVSSLELASFRLKIKKDKHPLIEDFEPKGQLIFMPDGQLNVKFKAVDDYGVVKVAVFKDKEKLFEYKDTDEVDRKIDLTPLKLSPGDNFRLIPKATDNFGQTSDSRGVRVQIVDASTFKAYLLEEHQRIYQKIEALISSMGRRVKRYEKQQLFEKSVEKSTLRSDLDKVTSLTDSMRRYGDRLSQLNDFEKLADQNERDMGYISSTVPELFKRLLRLEDPQLVSQKRILEQLKKISVRMAEGQDMHLIIRLMDQIIEKQNKVIKRIPE